jgi:hypothetical protein
MIIILLLLAVKANELRYIGDTELQLFTGGNLTDSKVTLMVQSH